MAITIGEFPTEYLDALDEVLMGATYASRYGVAGAEFVNSRQVSVPEIDFGSSPEPVKYDRFQTEGNAEVKRTVYTLDHDVQQVFYTDAVDSIDEAAASMTNITSEYLRTIFAPYVDKDLFKVAAAQAKTTGTTALSAANIKGELRKARTQFTAAGLSGGDLYMTSTALGYLEDATDRQWSNDTNIHDTVGNYDGFDIFEVPDETLGTDFTVISGGTQTLRYITKRAVAYLFLPGQHTGGDGSLGQFRWVFGSIVRKNRKPGIYANKAAA